jgi:hypothetical protein
VGQQLAVAGTHPDTREHPASAVAFGITAATIIWKNYTEPTGRPLRLPDCPGRQGYFHCFSLLFGRVVQRGGTLRIVVVNIVPLFAVALSRGIVVRSSPMALTLDEDEILSAAIAGVSKVAELVATVPAEERTRALEAAEKSYLETAHNLGYQDADAQQWASAVMSRLRIEEDSYRLRMLASPPTSPS